MSFLSNLYTNHNTSYWSLSNERYLESCTHAAERFWFEGRHLPGIPVDEISDLNSCLLYQELQVKTVVYQEKDDVLLPMNHLILKGKLVQMLKNQMFL